MADNKFSEEKQLARCEPMSRLQSCIAGKWKILILWYISFYKVQRFGELIRRFVKDFFNQIHKKFTFQCKKRTWHPFPCARSFPSSHPCLCPSRDMQAILRSP